MGRPFIIQEAEPSVFEALGQLMVAVYSNLEGFPGKEEQPGYYEMLAGIGRMVERPGVQLLVAMAEGEIAGGVVYFSDMAQYGSGGTATRESNASGFRLLAVSPAARGRGVGKELVKKCIELAKENQHEQLIIHTTAAMKVAWAMYERIGFKRSQDLDFMQGTLPVFGFRLEL